MIQERIVPDLWKEADVIPIPKSVAVKVLENDLRPISLTPILSKITFHFVAEWIMSQVRHLVDKKQFGSLAGLSIGKFLSRFEPVNGGVDLGPILFMIMINDLFVNWEDRWKYVDDSSLLETLTRNQESILQTTLDGINQWCGRNNMSLNPRKCKEILICFWKNNPDFRPLTIDEQPIELVKSAKLLGVVFNDDLTWNDHVTYIVKKVFETCLHAYMLRMLKRARADTKTLITMYVTRPILEYCTQVWHYNIPEYLSKDIERIQLRVMKIIIHHYHITMLW